MSNGLIVVTGATGHIGRALSETLLQKGRRVRVVGRSAERLEPLRNKGAEVFLGSVGDAHAMKEAFAGAGAAFIMIPPDLGAADFRAYQNGIGAAEAAGLAANKVPYVVHLSSVGGSLAQGAGPVNGLHDNEERLNKLEGTNVLHLRPSYFMENLLANLGLIKQMGIAGGPLKPDVRLPMIATKDIAAVAARRLLALDFKGKSVLELLGPKDFTMTEVARVLGEAIGKPDLKYVQFPYADAEKAMVGMGISPDLARLFNEMNRGFNEGTVRPTQKRTRENMTPTTLEEFARQVFAQAYKNSR
jgi:uncharacterized protein YbjT (DUF2867 family)